MRLLRSAILKLRSSKVIFRRKTVSRSVLLTNNEAMAHSGIADSGTEATLETLKFVNRAIKSLPVEENPDNYVRTVPGTYKRGISDSGMSVYA